MQGIADYEFLRPIGAGGNGRLFLARRPPRLTCEVDVVAVKVFARESTSDMFRRAVARLRECGAVRSPYLIPLYDVGQHDGVVYCGMEFLAGGSLAQPAQVVDAALQVRAVGDAARALAALHLAGVVHGAVKPGNVLLDPYGAKLSDPDLNHLIAPGLRHSGHASTHDLAFADPAALLGEPPVTGHDVWSIGVLMHWVASGSHGRDSLPDRDGVQAIRHVVNTRVRLSPTLAEPLRGIVYDCLAEAAHRPSAAEVADRIAVLAADMSTPVP
ncbi:MAG: protein kinase [Sporichthyaceae bacterium]|nr:protein kinase [Sporichthyaceae bacterium]